MRYKVVIRVNYYEKDTKDFSDFERWIFITDDISEEHIEKLMLDVADDIRQEMNTAHYENLFYEIISPLNKYAVDSYITEVI